MAGVPVYTVEDRSVLLPLYRRLLVDPVLPHLPGALHPNTITHAGHIGNLAGTAALLLLRPERGLPFALAALLVQFYLWCDHADGAHARRTGQCSAFGELLDHGLDLLNMTYSALLTAAALGASPLWWVVTALLIPGAGAMTLWEQAQTGVFRLGRLNQIEALLVLTVALVASALFGTAVFEELHAGPVTLRLAILLWVCSTILFGIFRGAARVVAKDGLEAVVPALGPLGFGAATVAAAALGAISTVAAVALVTAGNVYTGMRMLAHRLLGRAPRLDAPLVAGALALATLSALRLLGQPAMAEAGPALVTLAGALFGATAISDARAGAQELARAERAAVK
jgi:phosphatidylglycerophosphate synthase